MTGADRLVAGIGGFLITQLLACGSVVPSAMDGAGIDSGPTGATAQTFVYQCADRSPFTVRIEGERAWLFFVSETIALQHVPSGSGARFSDGSSTYWSKGDQARFEVAGQSFTACSNNRAAAIWEDAKLRGAGFRAVGNEPGWHLEIFDREQVLFAHNYGQDRYRFPATSPVADGAGRTSTYRLSNGEHRLTVRLQAKPCSDTMSGEDFETAVDLEFDGRPLSGCGRALH